MLFDKISGGLNRLPESHRPLVRWGLKSLGQRSPVTFLGTHVFLAI